MQNLLAWFKRQSGAIRGVIVAAVAVVVVVAAWLLWIDSGPGPLAFAGGHRVALAEYQGANPTGVPPSLAQASLVERGAYLAHAADCVVCHTARGGTPYAGGLAIKLPFGTIYSSNITPDKRYGIGNITDTQFLAALHKGLRHDGTHLYPAMPYASYTYMTDADALAIKAFLFSLSPSPTPNRATKLSFPFNQRWLMALWNMFFKAHERFRPNAAETAEWNRGAYLAEALGHCGECHTPRNIFFGLDNRAKYAGSLIAGWRAYNISSNRATGVGAWSDDALIAYLSDGHALGHGTASGPMGEAIDEGLNKLAREDVRAIVVYLRTIPAQMSNLPVVLAPVAPASPKAVVTSNPSGKQLFEGACASCHGWTGISPISPFATLTGARAVNDPSGVNVAEVIISGVHRSSPNGIISMPSFGDAYSDTEIAALANYVTARFGSKASQITTSEVASLRKQLSE